MPPKKQKPAEPPIFIAIREKNDQAREIALTEITALRKDLTHLEAILKGRRKAREFSPFDVVHGAFEIFRNASMILENEQLMLSMEEETTLAESREILTSRGARLLKKPAGWHWISPAGEMYFLGKKNEPVKAAAKLERLVMGPQKKPQPAKAQPAPKNTDKAE